MSRQRPTVEAAVVSWHADGVDRQAPWASVSGIRPPKTVVAVDESLKPAEALRQASQGRALLWRGGLDAARRLLAGMRRRRDNKPLPPGTDPTADFYRHRQDRKTRARVLGLLLVELDAAVLAELGDAETATACRAAYGGAEPAPVVSLRELLGVASAHRWQTEGVWVEALADRVHPRYGVFAPTRAEYVDLVAAAPLPSGATVFDVGTGTGVLAILAARRGAARVVATDLAEAAVACAGDNVAALGVADRVEVVRADLFPPGRADVVICNPPWLPGTPSSTLDAAVFDPGGRMLSGFVAGVAEHLNPGGEAWLVLSDLAELLGLREAGELERSFAEAGLTVLQRTQTSSRHPKSQQSKDLLANARRAERVSLWRLTSTV